MTAHNDPEQLSELRLLLQEYELMLQRTDDPEEQLRVRRILNELKSCILRLESASD